MMELRKVKGEFEELNKKSVQTAQSLENEQNMIKSIEEERIALEQQLMKANEEIEQTGITFSQKIAECEAIIA